MKLINQAEVMVQLKALLSMLIKFWVLYKGRQFLFQVCDRLFLKTYSTLSSWLLRSLVGQLIS
jgi:hypothetical protein